MNNAYPPINTHTNTQYCIPLH